MIILYLTVFTFNSLTRTRQFSFDSMNYVDVAANINSGQGISQTTVGFNQPQLMMLEAGPTPFTSQPPLYPLTIALLNRLGISLQNAALLISALGYGVIILLGYILARRNYGSTAAILIAGVLTYYPPMRWVCRFAWSEPLGLTFLLMALWFMTSKRSKTIHFTFLIGIICGLAFGTRYALAPLFVVGLAYAFVQMEILSRKALRAVVYNLGFLIPAGLVIGHNFTTTGSIMPATNPSNLSWFDHFKAAYLSLAGEYLDNNAHTMQIVLLNAVIMVSGLWLAWKRRLSQTIRSVFLSPGGIWVTLWSVGYFIFLVVQQSTYNDRLDTRLVVPAGITLVILGIAYLTEIFRIRSRHALIFALLLVAVRVGEETSKAFRTPPRSMEREIASSARLTWIKQHTTVRDLIMGDNTMDLPFYFGYNRVLSFSPYPHSDYLDYKGLKALAARHGAGAESFYLVLRDAGKEEVWRKDYGNFITDLVSGKLERYHGIVLKERIQDGYVFQMERMTSWP
jgi:hypothetical protein